jgi:hypothetical protein
LFDFWSEKKTFFSFFRRQRLNITPSAKATRRLGSNAWPQFFVRIFCSNSHSYILNVDFHAPIMFILFSRWNCFEFSLTIKSFLVIFKNQSEQKMLSSSNVVLLPYSSCLKFGWPVDYFFLN